MLAAFTNSTLVFVVAGSGQLPGAPGGRVVGAPVIGAPVVDDERIGGVVTGGAVVGDDGGGVALAGAWVGRAVGTGTAGSSSADAPGRNNSPAASATIAAAAPPAAHAVRACRRPRTRALRRVRCCESKGLPFSVSRIIRASSFSKSSMTSFTPPAR
ncbi:hypothetical protein ACWGR4_41465 [Embleya sp. NPDC055664]